VAILEEYGALVRPVDSADAALRILSADGDGFAPEVLVSDVGMPGTDGFALVREIRKSPSQHIRKLPAIAVTACANPEDRVRALGRATRIMSRNWSTPTCSPRRLPSSSPGRRRAMGTGGSLLFGFGLGLRVGLPVLGRLRARLDAFKIRIDSVPARRVIGFLHGDFLPAGLFLFLTFLALALALALLLRGSRFVHGAIV
jgi:CheY-like chemotaxis protein